VSDGSLGPFAPQSSLSLVPVADGAFRFTTIDIPEQVLVSVDRSTYVGTVYLLATGDITIRGALDAGPGDLVVETPGTIYISGKTYGGNFTFGYGAFDRVNNPGGYPDEHYMGPGGHVMINDGALVLPLGQTVEQTGAWTLTGGVIMTQQSPLPLIVLETSQVEAVLTGTSSVPVPPALGLFAAGLGALGAAVRRGRGSNGGR
jgi:hypothetical protein